MAAKKPTKRSTKKPSTKFDLRCPDCDFVAAHPMGLGRHRSTRHGMISKRQSRVSVSGSSSGTGAWITRQQAADRAAVHYNTVRQWERTGVLRRGSRPGARETLVSAADVARLAATRGGRATGLDVADSMRLATLERAHRDLADGLEKLVASLRAGMIAPSKVSAKKKPTRTKAKPSKPKAKKASTRRAPVRSTRGKRRAR